MYLLELWIKSQKDTPCPTLLIISLEIVWTWIIFPHATLKFHQY